MAPILELDYIGLQGERANARWVALDYDAAAATRDRMRVPAVDRRFEQQESLLDFTRQRAGDGGVGLADAAAQVRGNV
jgi:hypothetical protein